jgi:hypothetical protein
MFSPVVGAEAPLGLDRCQCAKWHCDFASASLACHLAVFFDLGVFFAADVAKAQDDELAEFCFYDLVDVEGHFASPLRC